MTLEHQADRLLVRLEGRLAGPLVAEADRCWHQDVLSSQSAAIVVDLSDVVFIDTAGRSLLVLMHRSGAQLRAAGLLTQAIVAQVTAEELPAATRNERARLLF